MINLLPPEVYNRIAAGEVVDRPYSVVKELVENALDAGADEITVEIEQGGKKKIRVTDNGCGILRSDLKNAFLPHATSKLKTAEDLFSIATLGFRGEAVASIAAVSKMNITSRREGEEAYSLSSDGGILGEIQPAAGAKGTCVTVEDLFSNTPARLKFMKQDAQEEADVANMVARFVLSRPQVSFTYLSNGKVRYRSYGDGLKSALAVVYGARTIESCIEIDAEKHGLRLHGFLGNQNFFKPNRTYQSLFLNNRYIVNQTVSSALTNAYSSYLMKRQYPFYVLFLDVPPQIVDVNVHPNKADVRFADNQIIYGTVYSIVSSVLDGSSRALEYTVAGSGAGNSEPRLEQPSSAEPLLSNSQERSEFAAKGGASQKSSEFAAKGGASRESSEFAARGRAPRETMSFEQAKKELAFDIPVLTTSPRFFSREQEGALEFHSPAAAAKEQGTLEFHSPAEAAKEQGEDAFEEKKKYLNALSEQPRIDPESLIFRGELFETYLIYEAGDSAYFIDQHAAHERILYDRLKARLKQKETLSQQMILPEIMQLNAQEYAFLEQKRELLCSFGFEIEPFGGTSFKIFAVPADLFGMDVRAFLSEVLSSMESLRAIKLEDILKDRLASMACKAAVKGGDRLTEEEARALIREMDGDMGLKCPHGRPVCVRLKKTELEKLFKRIV